MKAFMQQLNRKQNTSEMQYIGYLYQWLIASVYHSNIVVGFSTRVLKADNHCAPV
jgi:hypothetical protein